MRTGSLKGKSFNRSCAVKAEKLSIEHGELDAAGLVSLGKHAGGWANNACEKGEQWKHVLDLFEKMRSESVQRDAITYSAARID